MDFEEDDAFEGIPQNVYYWEEARLYQSSFQLLVHTHAPTLFIHSFIHVQNETPAPL